MAPSAIDAKFKGLCPYVSELLVYGEAKPYCVALIGLDNEAITEWAGKQGLAGNSFAEIASDEKTQELIAGYIDELNLELNRWEQIRAIRDHRPRALHRGRAISRRAMKLRRKVVMDKFTDRLSALYPAP